MKAIELDGVTKCFDSHVAVSTLTLQVKQGSIFGLLGPNGAGKTTTLRMIMRVLVPDAGAIRILDQPLTSKTQDLLGYLPEERGLYPRMKVREVVTFLGAMKGLSEAEAERRTLAWLERLELAEWADKKVNDLSKGMQQKVQFIAAIIHRPAILILDEPFSGLDPVNAALVKDIILDLRQQGATIVLSTHRMEQVEMMCDSICLIDQGQSILDGDLRAIRKSYGKNTLRIGYSGGDEFLNQPEIIESLNHFGAVVEVKLLPGADPQAVLRSAVASGVSITHFELIEPSLNDIFIEKVGQPCVSSGSLLSVNT